VNNTSATKITRLSTITTVIAVATAAVIVVTVVIAAIAAIVVTDTMEIATKAAVAAAVVTAVTTTVISTRTLLLLLVPVARARPLLDLVLPPARLTTAHSMRSTTELTPMPPTVDTKTMSHTTNTTKQPPLNSNSSNKRQRPLLLHPLRQVRHRLHLLQVQDPLPLLQVEPLVEEAATVRYVPCIYFYPYKSY
jgi:hypothetical protein